MRHSVFCTFVLGFSALTRATFLSPSAGDSWMVGQEQTIKWETSGISGPIDIFLAPAGAKDSSSAMSQIATQISNSGSYKWTPDASLGGKSGSIIAVDSSKKTIISSVVIIVINNNSGGGGYNKDNGKGKGMGMYIMHTSISTATRYHTSTVCTTTVISLETMHTLTYVQTVSSPDTLVLNFDTKTRFKIQTTPPVYLNTTTIAEQATTPPPLTTATSEAVSTTSESLVLVTNPATVVASNTSAQLQINATATAPPVFTGAASPVRLSDMYTVAAGGSAVLIAMLLL
jgi:hypothetical protein